MALDEWLVFFHALGWKADLVVLNACETGLVKEIAVKDWWRALARLPVCRSHA